MSKFLFFNWKDFTNPNAGGAELVVQQICNRLVVEGHQVTFITSSYMNSNNNQVIDGVEYIRLNSGKMSLPFRSTRFYITNLKNQFDYLIECVNTVPYFLQYFKGEEKLFLLYHQLAKEVWFYETQFPLSYIGYYILEPIAIKLQTIKNIPLITISNSSKADLVKHGFQEDNISIITMGTVSKPLKKYDPKIKNKIFTVLFHSSLRPMKRCIDVIIAFHLLSQKYNDISLIISGSGDNSQLLNYCITNNITNIVNFCGKVTELEKLELMKTSSVLVSTSIKEGWGIIVTEANSMATPAITYDVDGLRDSCKLGGGQITIYNDPESIFNELETLYLMFKRQKAEYDKKCVYALQSSYDVNFDNCYKDFKKITLCY